MGRIICAGLGPGDPDLISVRSDRAIRAGRHIAYFRKAGRQGQARRIVEGMLAPGAVEHAMEYPVTTEIPFDSPDYNRALAAFYDDWTERLAALVAAGQEVVVLCEGDPFFYGSFMHLYVRLKDRVPVEVIPGIPGMVGCWNATGQPITWGDDVLTVAPATLPEAALTARIAGTDALVVMKIGQNLPKLKRAVELAGRMADAWLVEYAAMAGERVRKLAEVEAAPYFSIALIHGQGRRP